LEDDQKFIHDLTTKTLAVNPVLLDEVIEEALEIKAEVEEKVIFELIEEEIETPIVAKINENDLIAMNDFIRNLDVTFEIVSPMSNMNFEIQTPVAKEINEIKVVDTHVVTKEEQITFTFDMPASKAEVEVKEERILFELSDETRDIQVNEHVEFVSVTELNKDGIVKYSLEEYMEIEKELTSSKPAANAVNEPVDSELDITLKPISETSQPKFATHFEDVTPVEMTIEETLKVRADERRRKLKEFNYKFHSNNSRVEEFEKEPAYKRLGIDISENTNTSNTSRMSLGTDSNDDVQLRSNNSFLHDNVD
jgi:cell division protein FtsZ